MENLEATNQQKHHIVPSRSREFTGVLAVALHLLLHYLLHCHLMLYCHFLRIKHRP